MRCISLAAFALLLIVAQACSNRTTVEGEFEGVDTESDSDAEGDTDSSQVDTDQDSGEPPDIPPSTNNGPRLDRLTCEYTTISETETEFIGEITVGNANTEYVWNGYYFTIWSIDFTTTSQVTYAKTYDWIDVMFQQEGETVSFDMGWQSLFPLDTLVTFEVRGTKQGEYPYPSRCEPRYIRGDVIYPVYQDLPYTWWKGKEDLTAADLIHDQDEYYQESPGPIEESVFIYDPPHDTQILVGQPHVVPYEVNSYDNLRIRVPSRMMAMGVGFNYEWFKFNPAYFCALGTKENFACGFIPAADSVPADHQLEIDGEMYNWYILFGSPDGPFQQETGNFIDMARFFPDYYPAGALHDDYTHVSDATEDPRWASSVITSAISSVVTRETLWASHNGDYGRLIEQASDPWAELAMITYTYNQGIYGFCATGVMDDLDAAIAAPDLAAAYGLDGVNNHVATIREITSAMNQEVADRYDAQLTWSEVEQFLEVIRMFYGRGFPTDENWNLMVEDVSRAFAVLAEHWGGGYVSYRYDFLTLLRVVKQHLKKPTVPRPTTDFWRDRVVNLPC